MTLAHYIDLSQLLPKHLGAHAQNRALGLAHPDGTPTELLDAWRTKQIDRLEPPRWSDLFVKYHYWIGWIGGLVAWVLGMISGATLLSYSGKAPVNVVYFLALAVGIPLVTMGLAFISMARASQTHNALVHLSPASWMEKILLRLSPKNQKRLENLHVNPRLTNWLVIERAQMMAWWFAVGMLLALLGMVATQDVAFGWSTTLAVTPEQFHHLITWIAAPWVSWFPSAVPSVSLIEQSQFFRLGGKLDSTLIHHAAQLGLWWKFLAMATLVYALGLRTLIWAVAKLMLRRALRQAVLSLDGVRTLLDQMSTPVVQTASTEAEAPFVPSPDGYDRIVGEGSRRYDAALGWAMDTASIQVTLDALGITADRIDDPGGARTLAEDDAIIARSHGSILLLVKSWEPPMMEWGDFLTDLVERVEGVTVVPIGTLAHHYRPLPADTAVWSRRLASLQLPKVHLWHL